MAGWTMKLAGEKGRSPERPSSEQYEPLSECDGKLPKGTEQGTVTSHCAMKYRADVPCRPTLSSDGEAGWSLCTSSAAQETSSLSSLSSADQRPRDIKGLQQGAEQVFSGSWGWAGAGAANLCGEKPGRTLLEE